MDVDLTGQNSYYTKQITWEFSGCFLGIFLAGIVFGNCLDDSGLLLFILLCAGFMGCHIAGVLFERSVDMEVS
ncbi:MAG TPA: hypothetical protein PLF22_03060 [Pseudomonadales bacterium]|nr:hypothetical protein [Pseudomonadales bacterium]